MYHFMSYLQKIRYLLLLVLLLFLSSEVLKKWFYIKLNGQHYAVVFVYGCTGNIIIPVNFFLLLVLYLVHLAIQGFK